MLWARLNFNLKNAKNERINVEIPACELVIRLHYWYTEVVNTKEWTNPLCRITPSPFIPNRRGQRSAPPILISLHFQKTEVLKSRRFFFNMKFQRTRFSFLLLWRFVYLPQYVCVGVENKLVSSVRKRLLEWIIISFSFFYFYFLSECTCFHISHLGTVLKSFSRERICLKIIV